MTALGIWVPLGTTEPILIADECRQNFDVFSFWEGGREDEENVMEQMQKGAEEKRKQTVSEVEYKVDSKILQNNSWS